VSQRICFALDSLDEMVCFDGTFNCSDHMLYGESAANDGPFVHEGDSGGGLWRELSDGSASSRGISNAGGCDSVICSYYATKTQRILNTFNATVVVAP
jgi:hypothetical protein